MTTQANYTENMYRFSHRLRLWLWLLELARSIPQVRFIFWLVWENSINQSILSLLRLQILPQVSDQQWGHTRWAAGLQLLLPLAHSPAGGEGARDDYVEINDFVTIWLLLKIRSRLAGWNGDWRREVRVATTQTANIVLWNKYIFFQRRPKKYCKFQSLDEHR